MVVGEGVTLGVAGVVLGVLVSLSATRVLRSLLFGISATDPLILAGVLFSSFMTQKIGIHSIFGAFLFGAIMPKRSGMTRELTDKVEDFTIIVLLPLFFAVTGLRTNLFALNSPFPKVESALEYNFA